MAIPRSALFLGLAGLLPFYWGAATMLIPGLAEWTIRTIGARFVGPFVSLQYGVVILAFMSGVVWGFATRARGGTAGILYAASTLPALWAFLVVGAGPTPSAIYLMAGFVGLLGLDWTCWRHGLAPAWWMQLRLLLTAGVVIALAVVVL